MTALADNRTATEQMVGGSPLVEDLSLPVAAATTLYAGALIAVNTSGYAVPASADSTLKVVGRCEKKVNNSAGAAGDEKATVRRGTFKFANSGTTDAITAADLYRNAFVVDDQTVARTSSNGARPVAGRVIQVDTDGVWIETAPLLGNGEPIDIFLVAAADLSAKQYFAVKVDSNGAAAVAGAGELACGILQNAPASAAIAVVRVSGISKMIGGGTVAKGSAVAADSSGKGKVAVAGKTDTSDAGASADALIGSHVLAIALGLGAADTAFAVLITHSGAIPTTAA